MPLARSVGPHGPSEGQAASAFGGVDVAGGARRAGFASKRTAGEYRLRRAGAAGEGRGGGELRVVCEIRGLCPVYGARTFCVDMFEMKGTMTCACARQRLGRPSHPGGFRTEWAIPHVPLTTTFSSFTNERGERARMILIRLL